MLKKSKLDFKYIILIILGIMVVFLSITSYTVKANRKLSPVESVIKDTTLFVSSVITYPFRYIGDKISDFTKLNNLYKKYEILEEENKKVDLLNARIKELETEINKLNQVLELNSSLSSYKVLTSMVINRNIGYWYNNITVDKGLNSGVEVGMAVITSDGLIGKVVSATNLTSTIKLLTSSEVDNKVSVKIKLVDKDIYGLLIGYDKDSKTFIVEGIDENIDIPVDSMVVTTGMGGIFPSGILVGKVESVKSDSFDLSKIVSVKSQANFNDLTYVTILKGDK